MFLLVILSIVGLFCGGALAFGQTGFWLWLFAIGGDICAIIIVATIVLDNYIEPDDTVIKVINVIGTALWVITLKLSFSNVESKSAILVLIVLAGFFIAPYFIVASLDAFFSDSIVVVVFVGIAKILSSILLYVEKFISLNNAQTYNEIPGKLIAYFAIVSFLALLSFILVILKPAFCAIGNLKEQRQIKKERKRKQIKEKYSYQLISAVEKNDAKAVAALIEKGAYSNYKDFSGKVPLRIAMENNNKNMISLLLEKGANIECKDNKGCTLLQSAVENGNLDMTSFLLEKGAFINCKNSLGQTPLLIALRHNDKNMISLLMEKSAAINIFDSNSKSVLDFAIENEDADLVSFLLEKGAEIGDNDSSLKMAVEFAIKHDNADLLSRLAEKAVHEDVHCEDKPILFFAIENNYKKLVELLIEKGADIECKGKYEATPLLTATSNGNLDLVTLLLEKGANIECENEDGVTPLFAAIAKGYLDIISLLIKRGANIEHEVKNCYTPLGCAVTYKNKEIILFLLEKGANIEHAAKDGVTPLENAIYGEDKEIISLLIEKGADVNHVSKLNDTETTPLFSAISGKNAEEIVSLLLEKGADVNLAVDNGFTVLQKAVCDRNKNIVSILLEAGADPNKKSDKFGTPLMIAFTAVNREMISLLMKNGADPSEIFIVAAAMPKPDAAQFLLDNGADINCEFSSKTPLFSAICLSTKEMVLFLISHGADVNHEISNPSDKKSARTPLETAIVTGNAEMVSLLITYGVNVNYKTKNGNTPLLFAALHGKSEIVPILKDAGAVSNTTGKSTQMNTAVATKSASSNSSTNSTNFNAALVVLSKIIAKNGAEIFASENSQKLKALVSDLIPQENEIAPKLKQALSCDFAQIILDANGESDSKKESAFKKSFDKIAAETKLEKAAAIPIVKLIALSLDWNLENLNLE